METARTDREVDVRDHWCRFGVNVTGRVKVGGMGETPRTGQRSQVVFANLMILF